MKKHDLNYYEQIQAIIGRYPKHRMTPSDFEFCVLMPTFEKIVELSKERPVTSADILIFMIQNVVAMHGWDDRVLLDLLGRVKNSD